MTNEIVPYRSQLAEQYASALTQVERRLATLDPVTVDDILMLNRFIGFDCNTDTLAVTALMHAEDVLEHGIIGILNQSETTRDQNTYTRQLEQLGMSRPTAFYFGAMLVHSRPELIAFLRSLHTSSLLTAWRTQDS